MTTQEEARQSELDGVLDGQQVVPQLAAELFAVVDVLDQQPALRRVLTDPGIEPAERGQLIDALFGQRVSAAAQQVLRQAVGLRWGGGARLADALERQAVRAAFATAQASGTLESVEDELFRFGRLVDGDAALRSAISDRSAPLSARTQLITDLLDGRADAVTVELAKRAVAARSRSFDLTLESYLSIAAAQRGRALAQVVVARPLTDEQHDRLATVLAGQLGRPVNLQVVVDPQVIGGARVTVGDELIEGSVSGRLESARRQFH
ncbi:F0F1 ATP synthase subunit delta [Micropruina sp.]|uniref:F0F1 ATP synthase subunit delta n=1 Tax=Micropruina sp. TaxID=2737536 RepID=UPI0039E267C5